MNINNISEEAKAKLNHMNEKAAETKAHKDLSKKIQERISKWICSSSFRTYNCIDFWVPADISKPIDQLELETAINWVMREFSPNDCDCWKTAVLTINSKFGRDVARSFLNLGLRSCIITESDPFDAITYAVNHGLEVEASDFESADSAIEVFRVSYATLPDELDTPRMKSEVCGVIRSLTIINISQLMH